LDEKEDSLLCDCPDTARHTTHDIPDQRLQSEATLCCLSNPPAEKFSFYNKAFPSAGGCDSPRTAGFPEKTARKYPRHIVKMTEILLFPIFLDEWRTAIVHLSLHNYLF
jgi:hypothetical protein